MSSQNEMKLIFDARSVNESFARVAVAAFIAELNPTLDEIADIKTAVSEAVTNAIIHGYHEPEQKVELLCQIQGDEVSITVWIPAQELRMCQKRWSLFIRQNRNLSAPEWVSLLWKHLWTGLRSCPSREKGRAYIW